MELITTALTAALSIAVLFIGTKLMGHRQISQLDTFDYIVGITIGSIAAELATEIEKPIKPLIALVIYVIITICIDVATNKSILLRKFFNGKPIIILNNGTLYRENMKKSKLDLNEFLLLCRQEGFFDLSQIQTAIFEYNGRLTILPTAENRPVSPSDLKIKLPKETRFTEVIMDGRILNENLKQIGKDENWLHSQLKAQGYSKASQVFLGLFGNKNDLLLYGMEST